MKQIPRQSPWLGRMIQGIVFMSLVGGAQYAPDAPAGPTHPPSFTRTELKLLEGSLACSSILSKEKGDPTTRIEKRKEDFLAYETEASKARDLTLTNSNFINFTYGIMVPEPQYGELVRLMGEPHLGKGTLHTILRMPKEDGVPVSWQGLMRKISYIQDLIQAQGFKTDFIALVQPKDLSNLTLPNRFFSYRLPPLDLTTNYVGLITEDHRLRWSLSAGERPTVSFSGISSEDIARIEGEVQRLSLLFQKYSLYLGGAQITLNGDGRIFLSHLERIQTEYWKSLKVGLIHPDPKLVLKGIMEHDKIVAEAFLSTLENIRQWRIEQVRRENNL